MKQFQKLRLLFALFCVSIVLYIGIKKNMLVSGSGQRYIEYQLTINEIMINNRNSIMDDDGDFEDWIEIYNKGNEAVNLNGFGLSNNSREPFLWTFPDIVIEPKAFLIVWASEKNKRDPNSVLHTNFKLKSKDNAVIFTSPDKKWNEVFFIEPMGENLSYGRVPDGNTKLYGFDEGTPGNANILETLIGGAGMYRLKGPAFSHKGGFYTEAFDLVLKTDYADAKIYYTLDGSDPTEESICYDQPVKILEKPMEATVVRARTYMYGYPKSEIVTHSYFTERKVYTAYNTPIISLVTDPKNLFDYEIGIYVGGKALDQWIMNNPNSKINEITPANYNQRGKKWERKGSVELFEPDGSIGLVQNIGIRTHGGYSRANPLKPLSLYARKGYDDKECFFYNFFGNKAYKYSRLLLRTSATDSKYALFRDAFVQSLVKDSTNLDLQNSRPCIVFINGKYYGIHNIREAYDKRYISEHYSMDQESVVILKNPTGTAGIEIQEGYAGDEMHYNRMIKYIKEHDMKEADNYDYVRTLIDADNYIEYVVLQIYCDNRDWPGNNVSIWRKRTPTYKGDAPYGHDGCWRWLVYDLDYGFGLHYGKEAAQNNTLKMATEKNGPSWPNPPWSTFLLSKLLENEEFRNRLINIFADRLNTIFLPEVVAEKIEALKEIYYPNIMPHIEKWNLHHRKLENWLNEIEGMKGFAIDRPRYMRQYISEYFNLEGTALLKVSADGRGIVKINSLNIEHKDSPWEGEYFKGVPVTAEAVPEEGYVFYGWEGISMSKERLITIDLSQDSYLKAVFKRIKNTEPVQNQLNTTEADFIHQQ